MMPALPLYLRIEVLGNSQRPVPEWRKDLVLSRMQKTKKKDLKVRAQRGIHNFLKAPIKKPNNPVQSLTLVLNHKVLSKHSLMRK